VSTLKSFVPTLTLVTGHACGMIDLPALPIWVGVLVAGFGFAPATAGGLATLFLIGAVTASVGLSPFFHRIPGRWVPTLGFGVSAVTFFLLRHESSFSILAPAHFVAGFATGLALSFVHGTMGRTTNQQRVFAMGGLTLGLVSIVFLGGAPVLIQLFGPQTIFRILAGVMAFACVVTAVGFPSSAVNEDVVEDSVRFGRPVWFAIFGIMLMALNQSMTMSFLQRIGLGRGLSAGAVQAVLVIMGIVATTAPMFAALLQKRLPALTVGVGGAAVQGLLALIISTTDGIAPYAIAGVLFPSAMLFTHTFIFGHLARIEPTGRAVAATPAMIMTGSAIAPLLGGVLTQTLGYPAIGVAALILGVLALTMYLLSGRSIRKPSSAPGAVTVG
jgi:predicted MFS family arabinose efflux permease